LGIYCPIDRPISPNSCRNHIIAGSFVTTDRQAIATEVNRSPSQVALNWLIQQPGKPIPIVGARKVSHLEDNLGALDFTLDTTQLDRLNQASSFALPFPHSFITSGMYKNVVDGQNSIERGFTAYG
jgi:diketogulonate reductase-like aldo/keto reductase